MESISLKQLNKLFSKLFDLLPDNTKELFLNLNLDFYYLKTNHKHYPNIVGSNIQDKIVDKFQNQLNLVDEFNNVSKYSLYDITFEEIERSLSIIQETYMNSKYQLRIVDKKDLFYLLRIWGYFVKKENGINKFYQYYIEKIDEILKTNPLKKERIIQGLILHFFADNDEFKFNNNIIIRRLFPWEFVDKILDILSFNKFLQLPTDNTLVEANFILEIYPEDSNNLNKWLKLYKEKEIVDIIAVASKGFPWIPVFTYNGWKVLGTKGDAYKGISGRVPSSDKENFIKKVRMGLQHQNEKKFTLLCRSLRQEENNYGFEYRLLRLYTSLELLLKSSGKKTGIVLAWLIKNESEERKNIYQKFIEIQKLRNVIAHKPILYDIMTIDQQSKTLESIYILEKWLLITLNLFLSQNKALSEWQLYIENIIFGNT